MASTSDEGPVLDTAMEQDEDMAQGKADEPKATYKSFKYVVSQVVEPRLSMSTSLFAQTNTTTDSIIELS